MRHGSSRRQRNRGNNNQQGRRSGPNRSQVFDSNGPDVRIRGTAYQVAEKYMALAKDSAASGDRILAESYLQHAEHYHRIIASWTEDVHDVRAQQEEEAMDDEFVPPSLRHSRPRQDARKDDLSLPASILGVSSEAASKVSSHTRTPETAV